jgi:hypothetical protein
MSYLEKIKTSANRSFANMMTQLEVLTDINLELLLEERRKATKNPFSLYGKKVFSQNDEDGLTLEIIKRIGINNENSYFAEFGIGDGTECNSIILALQGYKGTWVGNETLVVDTQHSKNVKYLKTWVTLENITDLIGKSMEHYDVKKKEQIKIISLDLDGNDFYFTSEILKSYRPDLFIVEYNAFFPPPAEFCINYNPEHVWQNDNYFGCSLSTYNALFEANGYFLVCCNLSSGSNAFFVKKEYRDSFPEIPDNIDEKYVPPFNITGNLRKYHKNSAKVINQILAKG